MPTNIKMEDVTAQKKKQEKRMRSKNLGIVSCRKSKFDSRKGYNVYQNMSVSSVLSPLIKRKISLRPAFCYFNPKMVKLFNRHLHTINNIQKEAWNKLSRLSVLN